MILSNKSQFLVDYQNQKLNNVFVLNNPEGHDCYYDGNTLFYGTPEWSELFEVEHCLIIATPVLDNDEVIIKLQGLAAKGVCVFLLLGKPSLSQHAINSLAGHCCIRAGVMQNGSLVIADHGYPNSYALILSSLVGNQEPNQYLSRLNETQEDAYFDIFCRLFWHEAKYEYLSQSHPLDRSVDKKSSPVQEIDVAHKHIFPESLANYLLKSSSQASQLYSHGDAVKLWGVLDQSDISIKKETDIWLNLEQVSSQSLTRLAQKSDNIFLSEIPLIQMINADNEAWVLPEKNNSDYYNWVLKLTDEQLEDCIEFNEVIASRKNWALNTQLSVAEINSPIRYLEQVEEQVRWQNNNELDLGKVECTDFQEYENSFKPGGVEAFSKARRLIGFDKTNLAKKISFSIDIQPPRIPVKALPDKLEQQWLDTQEHWDRNVDKLYAQLEKIENSKKTITDDIRNFMGSFLTGQLTSKRSLIKELDQLSEVKLHSLSPSHREEQIAKIEEVAKNVLNRATRLTKEQDKAVQQLQWKNKQATLNNKVQLAMKEKQKAEQAVSDNEVEFNKEKKEQTSLLIDGWLDFLDKALLADQEELIDLNCDDIIKWVNIQNNKQNSAKNKIINNEDIKNDDLKSIRRLVSNYQQKLSFISKENKKLNDASVNAKAHLERTERDIDKHGVFSAKERDTQSAFDKLLGIDKSENANMQFDLPKEDPPQVGKLFSKGQQRYLLIKYQKELEQGKMDCKRLNAKLVIAKDELNG